MLQNGQTYFKTLRCSHRNILKSIFVHFTVLCMKALTLITLIALIQEYHVIQHSMEKTFTRIYLLRMVEKKCI